MNVLFWDVFDRNLTSELDVHGQGERSQRVCVAVFGSQDLLEVAAGEFGLPRCDNLQVCDHPIICGGVFSIDLAQLLIMSRIVLQVL